MVLMNAPTLSAHAREEHDQLAIPTTHRPRTLDSQATAGLRTTAARQDARCAFLKDDMTTTQDIMKLADDFVANYYMERTYQESPADTVAAKAALQSEVDALVAERDALQAKLDDAWRQEPVPPFGSKRKAAMAVYKPPFAYKHGYIYDSQQLMVSDHGPIGEDEPGVGGAVAARVRGWGKLGYLPNGAELQDEIGRMMADALNALYTHAASQGQPSFAAAQDGYDAIWNALQRIESAAVLLPTFQVKHEGGIEAVAQNIVDAIAAVAQAAAPQPLMEPVADRAFLERALTAMEGVIDVADRKTDEFDALRACIVDLTLMLYSLQPAPPAPQPEKQGPVVIPDCGEAGHDEGACGNRECLPSFNRSTHPAPQPLTDEWLQSAGERCIRDGCDLYGFAQIVIAEFCRVNGIGAKP